MPELMQAGEVRRHEKARLQTAETAVAVACSHPDLFCFVSDWCYDLMLRFRSTNCKDICIYD